ncbi:hypothetical protein CYL16_12235 [Mycobacterium sp. EPG1]|nr:hypothetical protein CYL16_12235 [Mycobacterium sp. EPG1]
MQESVLLTDDEIVALCAIDGRPWPLGLITVEAAAVEVARAGMRGMRSLMIREYVREVNGSAPEMNAVIAQFITTFLTSPNRVGVYVAPVTDPATLGGASVTAASSPDGWVVDSATAAGVHAIRAVSPHEALEAVSTLIVQAQSGTLFAEEADPARWICVASAGSERVIVDGGGAASALVRKGVLESGHLPTSP